MQLFIELIINIYFIIICDCKLKYILTIFFFKLITGPHWKYSSEGSGVIFVYKICLTKIHTLS